jgi:hypothetical protein
MLADALLALLLWQSPTMPLTLPAPPRGVVAIAWPPFPVQLTDGRFVDAQGHVCTVSYLQEYLPAAPIQILTIADTNCFTAAGIAWTRTSPLWTAWLAANAPNPTPWPQ